MHNRICCYGYSVANIFNMLCRWNIFNYINEHKALSGRQLQCQYNQNCKYMLSVQCCQLWSLWVSWWTTACWGVCSREPPDHHTAVHPTEHQETRHQNMSYHYTQTHNSSHLQCSKELDMCFQCCIDNRHSHHKHQCACPATYVHIWLRGLPCIIASLSK